MKQATVPTPKQKLGISTACITDCHLDLASAFTADLVLALGCVLARAWHPCLAVFHPGPVNLASAGHAGLALAETAACGLELADDPVVGTVSEKRLEHPAAVAKNVGYPAD